MANADKCHLQTPFPEWATGLTEAFGDVEGVNREALRRFAGQEFENYKAIERRINDPACAGGGEGCECSWALVTSSADLEIVPPAIQDDVSLSWTSVNLSSGGWSVGGGDIIAPDNVYSHNLRIDLMVGFSDAAASEVCQVEMGITDLYGTWRNNTMLHPGYDVSMAMSTTVSTDILDGGSCFVVVRTLVSEAVLTQATVWAFLTSTCCPEEVSGQG